MLQKVFLILLLGNIMLADFKTLSTQEVQNEIKKGTVLIDIRRSEEWEHYGVIENSYKITFFDAYGNYNIEQWMKDFSEVVTTKEQKFILICAHANRTKTVGGFLSTQLHYKNVYELDGGINYGWLDKGLKTVK